MAIEPGKELMWKAALGKLDKAEETFFQAWLSSSPEHQKEFDKVKMLLSVSEKQVSKEFKEMNDEKPDNSTVGGYRNFVLGSLLLILVILLLFLYRYLKN